MKHNSTAGPTPNQIALALVTGDIGKSAKVSK
jgi:hypothetical protein